MVIGILGIKNENIQKANVIKTLKNICDLKSISIVEPISEYKSRIDELYSCNYPIFTNIKLDNANIKEVVQLFNLNKINNLIILPDFLGTNYWIKISVDNLYEFFSHMYKNKYFDSLTVIFIEENKIIDIELGENNYELRIIKL